MTSLVDLRFFFFAIAAAAAVAFFEGAKCWRWAMPPPTTRREGDLPMVSRGIIESCNTHSVRSPSTVAIIAFAVKRRFAACDFT